MSKIKIFGLGGLNENGKNMYIVNVDDNIFVFDAGLKYPSSNMLGVDYIIPNFDYLKENRDKVRGIFITHGHEGNMGAISDILKEMPDIHVYATKFTMNLIKKELSELKIEATNLKEIRPHSKLDVAGFSIFPIEVTHSIPESVLYVLYTDDGAIVYATDFVFDSTMLGSYKTDIGKLAYVGKQGVLCLLCESCYAYREGHTSPSHRIASKMWDILNNTEKIYTLNGSMFAKKTNGEIYAWGNNQDGQLGIGNTENQNTPIKVDGLSDVSEILYCAYVIKNDNRIYLISGPTNNTPELIDNQIPSFKEADEIISQIEIAENRYEIYYYYYTNKNNIYLFRSIYTPPAPN